MITAFMTGLGIGAAFWIIVIPTLVLLARNRPLPESLESIKLMKERNDLDREAIDAQHDRLGEIRDAIYHLSK